MTAPAHRAAPRRRTRNPAVAGAVGALLLLTAPLLAGCNAYRYGLPALGGPPAAEFTLELEPLVLPAGATHEESPQPEPLRVAFPADAWLHAFHVDLVDIHGDAVPGAVLHHVKLLMPGHREIFHPIALRLIGAGAETRSADLPARLGVPIASGDSLVMTAMLHNPTDRVLADVRVRVRIRYTPRPADASRTAVYPFFLHVTEPLEESHYDLPPGRSEASWEGSPATPAYILGLGGHIHRYGVALRLEDVTAGRVLWRSDVRSDASGEVVEIPRKTFLWNDGIRLSPDRVYRVTVTYDNPTGTVIPGGGMGTIGGIVRPDAAWPPVVPHDPIYAADLLRELGDGHRHAHD
jgi:hypothetical protein